MAFNDIRRAARLQSQLNFYVNRLQNPPPSRPGTGRARPEQVVGYVIPFLFDLPANGVVAVSNGKPSFDILSPIINGTTAADLATNLGTSVPQTVKGFTASQIVVSRSTARTVSTPNSTLTGQPYLKYNNLTRLACKFGRGTATDDERDAFTAVAAAYRANPGGTFAVNRVSWIREKSKLK